jgi:formamidopyrimidine-DNA glycosylase
MPELPEVETVCRGLRPCLEGRTIARAIQRRADLRWALPERFADRLTGRRVLRVARRAKYILVHLDDGWVMICHLGMSGRMMISPMPGPDPMPHDHVVLETAPGEGDAGWQLRFNDARRFGMMDLIRQDRLQDHWLLAGLGPEPLSNAFNGPALAAALKGRRSPIKAALLDQRTVAGLGNIYVSEALFFAGISPRRQAYTVQGGRAERLAQAVRDVLTRAIAAGGSSLRDYVQADGELGYFQHHWAVYDKEGLPCPGCVCDADAARREAGGAAASGIRRIVQSGRSTFYCPRRQR